MVEFATGAFCLIVSSAANEIWYLLSGDWNDGHWYPLATGKYRGAFRWPGSSEVYLFWSEGSNVFHRAIQPAGNLPEPMPVATAKEQDVTLMVGLAPSGQSAATADH